MQRIFFSLLIFVGIGGSVATASGADLSDQHSKSETIKDYHISNPDLTEPDLTKPDLTKIDVLDLETAKAIALSQNPSLKAAMERVRQAKERVAQARSRYFPRLDADGSASRLWRSDSALETARQLGNVDDPEDRFTAGLSATYVLFDGFERKFANASARYGEQETKGAEMDARRLLLSAVARNFYEAQLAKENIAIATAAEAFNQRQVVDAEARLRVGTGSLSDMLNFQIQANSAKFNFNLAKQSYQVSMIGLAALLGISEAGFPGELKLALLENETPEELNLPEKDPLIAYSFEHRPDVIQAKSTVKRTESDIGEARAGFFPTIDLAGTYDSLRADDIGFEGDDFGGSVALRLTYNLFAGGLTKARVREAESRKAEAESALENVSIEVSSDVRQSMETLKLAQAQLALERSNAKLVKQNRDLVEKEYTAGQTSLVRLNEAQRDLTNAQGRLALALVGLRLAWQNLDAATGKILLPFTP
jgi:outer membrane protein